MSGSEQIAKRRANTALLGWHGSVAERGKVVALMNDALTVQDENERRYMDSKKDV